MSAFVVSRETMHRAVRLIANTTRECAGIWTQVNPAKAADELGRALFALNTAAVEGRYHSVEEGGRHDFEDYRHRGALFAPTGNDLIACYKALQCLVYQCSEDATNDSPTMGQMRDVLHQAAQRIVQDLPAYQAAPWCAQ